LPKYLLFLAFVAIVTGTGASQPRAPHRIDFARDIRPIFETSCYPCHGTAQQGANLRLDIKESVLAASRKVVVPGRSRESLLYRRVAGLDQPRMPMNSDGLAPPQIELIRTWIDQGAEWPADATSAPAAASKHWAYLKPQRPNPPPDSSGWARNPIDNFILAQLNAAGLKPSPGAAREALIRRASLDLTGLPPSPGDVDAFLADDRADAYEQLVERLLASPHYGERWAGPWLDLARYADTNGYEKDDRRSIWPYRDWVIDAFNRDLPFDRFTIEQLAGDLLPNATVDQKIATGFHRNSQLNEEGGIDLEEYRVVAVLDRVDTTATIWLGSTIGCAQCHNHKFDPFTQEEYYRLFAFFNNTEGEVDVLPGNDRRNRGPNLKLPAPRPLAAHRNETEEHIAALQELFERRTPEVAHAQRQWESETRSFLVPWTPLDAVRVSAVSGVAFTRADDGSFVAEHPLAERDSYRVVAETHESRITAVRLEVPADTRALPGGESSGNFSLTGLTVEVAPLDPTGFSHHVVFADAFAQSGSNVRGAIDDDPLSAWRHRPGRNPADTQAVFVAKEPFGFPKGSRLVIRLAQEAPADREVISRFRISVTSSPEPGKSATIPAKIQPLLATPPSDRTPDQKRDLDVYYRSISPLLEPVRERLKELRSRWSDLAAPATFVMQELPQPRKTHVHIRGSFLTKGKEVSPAVPAVLHPFPSEAPQNRLGLAQWLVAPENPLTSRVTMNRLWMHYFGRGIVETAEDFGSQGRLPTHPELLDWLATEFMRQKWSMKAMHRLIVTSATYRQASQVTPEHLEKDPTNRFLGRMPRIRLEAELVRDNALAVAGLLDGKIGGPSVFPPQPEGIWNLVYNDDKWLLSEGKDRYRRGLYTFWRRTAPYPMFVTFDAPSREISCTRRILTNTPLQALTTLNDPAFFDAARGLARRTLQEAAPDLNERAIFAFRACVARRPEAAELERVTALLRRELEHFKGDAAKAEEIALGGDVDPPEGVDAAEFAAWTLVANILLNLDETVTRP
jgi:hypothetical protein